MKKIIFTVIASLFFAFNCFCEEYDLTVVFSNSNENKDFFEKAVQANGFYLNEQFIPITLSWPEVQSPRMAYVYDIRIESDNIDEFVRELEKTGYFEEIVLHTMVSMYCPNSNLNGESISIYPNPFINTISVFSHNEGNIEIIDVFGKVVYCSALSIGIHEISTNHFCKGTYVVKIRDKNNSVQTFKIIKL